VVIPAYDEERRLPRSLEKLAEYRSRTSIDLDVLVVDDGSRDGTATTAEACGRRLSLPLRVVRQDRNRGKGAAVRAGVLQASGDSVLVSDADFSTPIEEWERLQAAGADVAIGSRGLDESYVKERQPFFRQTMGKLFNLLVRLLAVPGVHDTQCGFKLFRREAAREIFSRARVDRFAYDVESLLLARRLGFTLAEVPVLWFNSSDSRVSLAGGAQAFLELFRIRLAVARRLRAEASARRPPAAP
jgi:dolichyl-phosphate beta-glucosyltransferase